MLNIFNIAISGSCLFLLIIVVNLTIKILSLNKRLRSLRKEIDSYSQKFQEEKNRFQDELNRLHSVMLIITELVNDISSVTHKEDEVLKIIFEKIGVLLYPQKYAILKFNPQDNLLKVLYYAGYHPLEFEKDKIYGDETSGLVGWAVNTGRFVSLQEAQRDPTLQYLIDKTPFTCTYCQPIKIKDRIKAILCIDQIDPGISEQLATRILSIISSIGSVSLDNVILTEELRQRAIKDGLTGLYNHSYFQQHLKGLMEEVKTQSKFLSLVMVDIDHFKKFNDTFGHQAGDQVLKEVANHLNSAVNEDAKDLCARYGGEEFAVVFFGKTLDETFYIADNLRARIAEKDFDILGNRVKITLSMGVAEFDSQKNSSLESRQLIKRADSALYEAKSEGRNRVVKAEKTGV